MFKGLKNAKLIRGVIQVEGDGEVFEGARKVKFRQVKSASIGPPSEASLNELGLTHANEKSLPSASSHAERKAPKGKECAISGNASTDAGHDMPSNFGTFIFGPFLDGYPIQILPTASDVQAFPNPARAGPTRKPTRRA